MNIPLVSEYKVDFIGRRVLQTFFGGIKFDNNLSNSFSSDSNSYTIFIFQLLLFLYPLFLGIFINILIEINIASDIIGSLISAISSFTFTFAIQFVAKEKLRRTILPESHAEIYKSHIQAQSLVAQIFPNVIQKSFLTLLLHSIVSALLVALTVYNLHPTKINEYIHNWVASFIIYTFGWFACLSAHFSVLNNPPPETATYSTNENQLVASLNRPFYILLTHIAIILLVLYESTQEYFIVASMTLMLYPFLFLLGILPPLYPLLLWLTERINVILFGASPTPNLIWLLISSLISIFIITVCWLVSMPLLSFYLFAIIGHILSCDVFSMFKRFKLSSFVYLITNILAIVVVMVVSANLRLDREILIYFNLFIITIVTIINKFQCVYLLKGLFRNPFYPKCFSNTLIFSKFNLIWKIPSIVVHACINLVIPLINLFYITLVFTDSSNNQNVENNSSSNSNQTFDTKNIIMSNQYDFYTYLAIYRVYRTIWQNTYNSSLILIAIFFIEKLGSKLITNNLPLEWLIAEFISTVIFATFDKLYLVLILMMTSVGMKKQRLSKSWQLFTFDVIIFPAILLLIFLSSIISSPILPLFTLPIFIINFARPTHFWSSTPSKSEMVSEDTIYYEQLVPQFVKNIEKLGVFGSYKAGDYLLARYEDRLLWIQVIEDGFNYIKIQIKGLELQETSCHAVEATTIDELLREAFYSDDKSAPFKLFNSYFWFTLTPTNTVMITSYSDARNVLTGVIDSPDIPLMIKSVFSRVFIWVTLKYKLKKYAESESESESIYQESNLEKVLGSEKRNASINEPNDYQSLIRSQNIGNMKPNSSGRSPPQVAVSAWSDDEDDDVLGPETSATNSLSSRPTTQSNFEELKFEKNSDEIEKPVDSRRKSFSSILIPDETKSGEKVIRRSSIISQKSNDLPVVEEIEKIEKLDSPLHVNVENKSSTQNNSNDSSIASLLLDTEWLAACSNFIYQKRINSGTGKNMFSDEWFLVTLNTISDNEIQLDLNDAQTISLLDSYQTLASVCYSCISSSSNSYSSMPGKADFTPQSIHQIFNSIISEEEDTRMILFRNNKNLKWVTLKSFRYAVKIVLDQILLGSEAESQDELIEILSEYDNEWHIGPDYDPQWKKAVLEEKKFIFSIGKDHVKDVFTSHLLTLKSIPVHVCKLNRAVIEGIWSSLSLELLYLTNDDEERYSIQAHPAILRNLTVQAADAPLGYPVFVSDVIQINRFVL